MSPPQTEIPAIDKATKLQLSEADVCTKLITPAIAHAGWDTINQMRQEVSFREYFTDGQILFEGKRTKRGDREENEHAWKVSIDDIKANNCNLDVKNPHQVDEDHGDPEELLAEYKGIPTQVDDLRNQLRDELAKALKSTTGGDK